MKMKFLGIFLGVFGALFFAQSANAQRVELLLQDDQLLKGARSALQNGNHERALFYLEEALKRKNLSRIEMIEVHNDLCVTYIYVERFEEAIEQCQASIEIQSNRWETYNNLGTVYLVMGAYQNAIDTYEKALKMKPKSQILLFNLDIAKQRLAKSMVSDKVDGGSDTPDQPAATYKSLAETNEK